MFGNTEGCLQDNYEFLGAKTSLRLVDTIYNSCMLFDEKKSKSVKCTFYVINYTPTMEHLTTNVSEFIN